MDCNPLVSICHGNIFTFVICHHDSLISDLNKLTVIDEIMDNDEPISEVAVQIDPGHLFRYKSEVNPVKKKSKGGFLKGKIVLPEQLFSPQRHLLYPQLPPSSLRVVLSTYPDEDLEEKLRKDDPDPAMQEFHPTVLFIGRKSGKFRLYDKEPVPNYQMFQQELIVENGAVKILNKKSEYDGNRNKVLEVDNLFSMDKDNTIHLGDGDKMLNVLVLKNNTDARSAADNDEHLTLKKMIETRVPEDKEKQNKLAEYFRSKKKEIDYRSQLRIKVDVFDENNMLLASGISERIVNTESGRIGAFKFYDATPLISCTEGGVKIVMISEFPLITDIEPQFQLWEFGDHGARVDAKKEEQLLNQPKEVNKVQNTIIFISPPQPNYLQIMAQNYQIKLVAVRKSDKMESNSFEFVYENHMSKFTFEESGEGHYEVVSGQCIFCGDFDSTKACKPLPKLDTAKPNHKRKFFSKKQIPKIRRLSKATGDSPRSTASDSGIDLSPDIPEFSIGALPPDLGFNSDTTRELETLQSQDSWKDLEVYCGGIETSQSKDDSDLEEHVLIENGIVPDGDCVRMENQIETTPTRQSVLDRIISHWQLIPWLFLACIILIVLFSDLVTDPGLFIGIVVGVVMIGIAYVANQT